MIKSKYFNLFTFLISSFLLFISGVLFTSNSYLWGLVAIVALLVLGKDYMKTSIAIEKKIDGNAVTKITASPTEPKNPVEGELWIKYDK